MITFALLSTVSSITIGQLRLLAGAATPGLAEVARVWNAYDKTIQAPAVRVVGSVAELQDTDVPVIFVPTLDQPLDAAYHYQQADQHGTERVYALVLADDFQGWSDITQSADHEMKEALCDPACNQYIGRPALEICDPVQEDVTAANGIVLSAWVTPAWFGVGAGPTCLSDAGFSLAPGEISPGGYVQYSDGTQSPPGYRTKPSKDHPMGRRARRLRSLP